MSYGAIRKSDPLPASDDVAVHRRARDILVFGEDWGGLPSSTQHFMARLSRDRSVVWVNSIGMRRPRLSRSDLRRIVDKLRSGLSRSRASDDPARQHMRVLAPLAVSWPGIKAIDDLNATLLRRQIMPVLRERGVRDPIVWASLPSAVVVLDAIEAKTVVYYCGDDYAALPGVNPRLIRDLEGRMVDRADVVVAASEFLFRRLPPDKTVYLPHGVDVDLFDRPCPPAGDLFREDRPVAGYYGSIAPWIDIEMIARTAASMPDWDFVLIGPISTDVAILRRMSNVRLLGSRPHASLPSYSRHWSVSLLPSRSGDWAAACNPLKLREYLAAGRPIASVALPAIEPYADLLSVDHGSDFANTIRLAAADQGRNAARRARVRSESWTARTEQLKQLLDRL